MFTLVYFDVVGELRLESLSLPSSSQCCWCVCFSEKKKKKMRHASAQRTHKDLWSILRITWLDYSRRLRESESVSCCFMKHPLYADSHQQTGDASLQMHGVSVWFGVSVSCKPLLQTHFVSKTDRRGWDMLLSIRSTNLVPWFLALPNGDVTGSLSTPPHHCSKPSVYTPSPGWTFRRCWFSKEHHKSHARPRHEEPVWSAGLPSSWSS